VNAGGFQTCPRGVATEVPPTGEGEALTVIVGMAGDDPGGETVNVYASAPTGSAWVGSFVLMSAAAQGHGTRVAAFAALPGVRCWRLVVQGAAGGSMPLEVLAQCGPARAYSPLTLVSP
jgi:hypothetical protein